jgi:hypothetical protein
MSYFLGNINGKDAVQTKIKTGCFWSSIEDISISKRIPGVTQIEKIIRNLDKSKPKRFFKEFFLNTGEE